MFNQTIKDIVGTLEDMRSTFERAGISEKFTIFGECDKLPAYCHEEALTWLLDLHDGPYKECKKIRDLLSEAQWARYKLWEDFEEAREVILYNEKLELFKKACRGRPLIFRPAKCRAVIAEMEAKKPRNKSESKTKKKKEKKDE